MSTSLSIAHVTSQQLAAAGPYLESRGLSAPDGTEGRIQGPGIDLTYALDEASGLLTIDVAKLPGGLAGLPEESREAAFEQLVRDALDGSEALLGRPNKGGVYNYVTPTIQNDSGTILTYSSSDLSHGEITITTSTYTAGVSAQAFEADSTGGSGVGVEGRVIYTVAPGAPLLTIDLWLNGAGEHSFSAGLSGGNAYLYTATVTKTDPVVDSYTYLEPLIVVAKA